MSDPRSDSNSFADFLLFVVDLIRSQFLVNGDYFIVNNASIHSASEVADQLNRVLDEFGIRMIFLPTYSPGQENILFVEPSIDYAVLVRTQSL